MFPHICFFIIRSEGPSWVHAVEILSSCGLENNTILSHRMVFSVYVQWDATYVPTMKCLLLIEVIIDSISILLHALFFQTNFPGSHKCGFSL